MTGRSKAKHVSLAAAIVATSAGAVALTAPFGPRAMAGGLVPAVPAHEATGVPEPTANASGTSGKLWGMTTSIPARLYELDPLTGEATLIASVGQNLSGRCGLSLLDEVLYGSNILVPPFSVVSIDIMTGNPAVISDQDGSINWEALASNEAAAVLYSMDINDGVLKTLTADGTISTVGETGIGAAGMAYDDENGVLYAASAGDSSLYVIDTTDASVQLVGAFGVTISAGAGLAYAEDTETLFLNTSDALFTVDVATGVATAVGDNGVLSINGLAWGTPPDEQDPCEGCPCLADIDQNGVVEFADILEVLIAWGPCTVSSPAQGGLMYGLRAGDPGRLYTVNPATGQATLLVDMNGTASFSGLALLDEVLYGTDLFGYPGESGGFDTGSIDEGTGEITFVSDQSGSFDWHGLASDQTEGLLYAIDIDINGFPLKTLAPDGTIETIGTGTNVDGRGLAYDDRNGILYATNSGDDALYAIDTTDGTSTIIGALGVTTLRAGLAFDEATGTLYLNAGGSVASLYSVDTATGVATRIGSNGVQGIEGLAIMSADVCGACPCPADTNRDGVVDFADILELLIAWGPCSG